MWRGQDEQNCVSRSVVERGVGRCGECRLPLRWCICEGFRTVECPIPVDVLMHRREVLRPTSTGTLIQRVIPGSRVHVHGGAVPLSREVVVRSGRTPWILHPLGEPPPEGATPDALQLILLDGSWSEAARMRRAVESWGRLIRLPAGFPPSRYVLRQQSGPGMYATVESLEILLSVLGLETASRQLRVQFELHVYAGLRSRGAVGPASDFLAKSVLREAMPECLQGLMARRRQGSGGV